MSREPGPDGSADALGGAVPVYARDERADLLREGGSAEQGSSRSLAEYHGATTRSKQRN